MFSEKKQRRLHVYSRRDICQILLFNRKQVCRMIMSIQYLNLALTYFSSRHGTDPVTIFHPSGMSSPRHNSAAPCVSNRASSTPFPPACLRTVLFFAGFWPPLVPLCPCFWCSSLPPRLRKPSCTLE